MTLYQVARYLAGIGAAILLTACASYSGRGLKPGESTMPDILATMGQPAMYWLEENGRKQLAYPRGPEGTHTFMVHVGADGRLEKIENVLDPQHFARIENGKSDQTDVLRILGPSQPQWTSYFEARDELVWEWRFCDSWNQVARFDVLFDATSGIVRSTFQRPDVPDWADDAPTCGH